MKFDVTATVKEVGAIETVGAKGFQKRNLILSEQSGQYENLVCVEFSGDKLAIPEQFAPGQMVTVSGFINCREWNGKYFTSLRGSFINPAQGGAQDEYAQSYPQPSDIGEAPAFGQAPQQPFAQPVAAPQPFGAQPQAPAQNQQFGAQPSSPVPPMPSFPDHGSDDTPF